MLTTTDYHGNPVKIGDYITPFNGHFGADIIEGKKYQVVHIERGGALFFDESGRRRFCGKTYINKDLTPEGRQPLKLGEASPGDVVFFREDYMDNRNLRIKYPHLDLDRPFMVKGRSDLCTQIGGETDLVRLRGFPAHLYSFGSCGGFYDRRFYKKESCKPEEATHVLVLDNSSYERDGLKLGGFHEIAEMKTDFYKNFLETNKRMGTYGVRLKGFQTRIGGRPYFQGDRFFFFFKKESPLMDTLDPSKVNVKMQLPLGSDILKKMPANPKVEVPASLLKLWLDDLKSVREFAKDVADDLEVYIKKAEG
jgi:hypothetical protein